jgi:hypothetical protein
MFFGWVRGSKKYFPIVLLFARKISLTGFSLIKGLFDADS